MRGLIFAVWAAGLAAGAQQTDSAPAAADTSPVPDSDQTVAAQFPAMTQAWKDQHDPALRRVAAQELIEAAIHNQDDSTQTLSAGVVEDVVRDGQPANLLTPPVARRVQLKPLRTIDTKADFHGDNFPLSPVYRRITQRRFEAWSSLNGWLFDEHGKLLAQVSVPRRDGIGRDWFGAFLSDGTWITTDLWEHDEQLNCYDARGIWKWYLPGAKIAAALPKSATEESEMIPTFGWARADQTGRRWIVSVGEDYTTSQAEVDRNGRFTVLSPKESIYQLVYPRAMGPRGTHTSVYIDRDDSKASLHRDEPAHGPEVGWPAYSVSSGQDTLQLGEGTLNFGYWPHCGRIYVATDQDFRKTDRTWFFNAKLHYAAEIKGAYLADAANGNDLLVLDPDNRLVEVAWTANGVKAVAARAFLWPDGMPAVPLAIYDDLRRGFFQRGQKIVLASW
jgi:hypothetical protein